MIGQHDHVLTISKNAHITVRRTSQVDTVAGSPSLETLPDTYGGKLAALH